MSIQVYPLDKIIFDNVSISFGMENTAEDIPALKAALLDAIAVLKG